MVKSDVWSVTCDEANDNGGKTEPVAQAGKRERTGASPAFRFCGRVLASRTASLLIAPASCRPLIAAGWKPALRLRRPPNRNAKRARGRGGVLQMREAPSRATWRVHAGDVLTST